MQLHSHYVSIHGDQAVIKLTLQGSVDAKEAQLSLSIENQIKDAVAYAMRPPSDADGCGERNVLEATQRTISRIRELKDWQGKSSSERRRLSWKLCDAGISVLASTSQELVLRRAALLEELERLLSSSRLLEELAQIETHLKLIHQRSRWEAISIKAAQEAIDRATHTQLQPQEG